MLTAYILIIICTPLGFVWALFKQPKNYFFKIAVSLDQLGNVICMENLNAWLITNKSKYFFGSPDETISSVLGKNKRAGTLTRFGWIVDRILNKLDDNHSINAIEEDEGV